MRRDRKRLLQIEWNGVYLILPEELVRFELDQVELSDLYEMPFHYLNTSLWREFENVMVSLQNKGACRTWRIVNLN